jgi:hypothetical protein
MTLEPTAYLLRRKAKAITVNNQMVAKTVVMRFRFFSAAAEPSPANMEITLITRVK